MCLIITFQNPKSWILFHIWFYGIFHNVLKVSCEMKWSEWGMNGGSKHVSTLPRECWGLNWEWNWVKVLGIPPDLTKPPLPSFLHSLNYKAFNNASRLAPSFWWNICILYLHWSLCLIICHNMVTSTFLRIKFPSMFEIY